jgi:hypothetical protein
MEWLFIAIIAFFTIVVIFLAYHIIKDLRNPMEVDAHGNFVKPQSDGEGCNRKGIAN